jgi:hypothetical protein
VYDATVNGWLTDGGMSPHDAGNLLELHGIPCHAKTGATVEELMAELVQGHKSLSGVDSGEVWARFFLGGFFGNRRTAIGVTGVDMSDRNILTFLQRSAIVGAGKDRTWRLFRDSWPAFGFLLRGPTPRVGF